MVARGSSRLPYWLLQAKKKDSWKIHKSLIYLAFLIFVVVGADGVEPPTYAL